MKYAAIIAFIVFGCSTPQPQAPAQEKKKPTKEEMCADPNTPQDVLKLFCQ